MTMRVLNSGNGFPSNPTSGTVYHSVETGDATCTLQAVVNPTLIASALVTVEFSDDSAAWIEIARFGTPTGITLAALALTIGFRIPSGFWWRTTATNSTLGTLVAWY
jgi:hypothetical protein